MLIIDEATARELLSMKATISAMAESFRAISSGPCVALRGDVVDPERSSRGLLLGSYVGALEGVCFKVVGSWHGRRGGLIATFDTSTGEPEALLPAAFLTEFRTGAASGAATELLARQDSTRLAIVGTGRQAATQLEAMLAVRPLSRVTVWNRTAVKAESWLETAAQAHPAGVDFRLATTPRDACEEADIVVLCTRSEEPLLRGEWLRPGAHVNGVGASTPRQREVDESFLRRCGVISVDSRELALRTGDFLEPLASGSIARERIAEIGEILLGSAQGRTGEEQVTFFKSVGHAANDLAVARLVGERARAAGKGALIEL